MKILAEKYGVELVFFPKYHCELNPIEGLWCFEKVHIRKNTDGTFENLVELIESTKDMFIKRLNHIFEQNHQKRQNIQNLKFGLFLLI